MGYLQEKIFPWTNQVFNLVAIVDVMIPYGKQWKWPTLKDEIFYSNKEIIMAINTPERRGPREIFNVPELKDYV